MLEKDEVFGQEYLLFYFFKVEFQIEKRNLFVSFYLVVFEDLWILGSGEER